MTEISKICSLYETFEENEYCKRQRKTCELQIKTVHVSL